MECSQKHKWNRCTGEDWRKMHAKSPCEDVYRAVLNNWDHVAKPLDGLGRFEKITARIGAIQESESIDISKRAVIVMCADNGIVEEGISQSGQEITLAVAKKMGKNQSSVSKMAAVSGTEIIPVDIGINQQEKIAGVLDKKVCCGTANYRKRPAMTQEEALCAIDTGIEMVLNCKKAGYHILATGEMGIGNTSTSSAVAAALLGCDVTEVTGRGAGLSDEKLVHKQQIIAEAIAKYELTHADALRVLETVGGLDIAGLAGVCIGGALYGMPIVLDGVISMVAALVAERLVPGTKAYLIASHQGREPAVEKLAKELELEPVIDADMALGEGTGAVMMLSLLDIALSVYRDSTTFEDMEIEPYKRFVSAAKGNIKG